MSEPRYREWILETIDSLRSRKARPDLERICRMVRRRHGSDPDRTRAELEKLIQEQTVLKVSYKGSISYRNAAKVQRKCRKKAEQAGDESGKHAAFEHNNSSNSSGSGSDGGGGGGAQSPEGRETPAAPAEEPATRGGGESGGEALPLLVSASGNVTCASNSNSSCGERSSSVRNADGEEEDDHNDDEEKERKTCSSADSPAPKSTPKPKLRPGARGTGMTVIPAASNNPTPELPASADLGDRLVAAVRNLSERNRGSSVAGLKEILGFLSTQAGQTEEKLTRNRVKVVLEREIQRGRLRRSRLGHITVPARAATAARASARLPTRRAPQDGALAQGAVKVEEPMQTEKEVEKMEQEEPQPSNLAGPHSPQTEGKAEAVVTGQAHSPPGLEVKHCEVSQTVLKPEEQLQSSSVSSSSSSPSKLSSLHQETEPSEDGVTMQVTSVNASCLVEEQNTTTLNQLKDNMQDQAVMVSGSVKIPASIPLKSYSGCKTEVGVSSCLLTPSASPGAAEERGMNGGIFVKSESSIVNPVDWTVADVASYFTAAGFPEQALAFRTQEIDGKSLLLMQRNDVLTGLSIRLGPALKIYERHVKVLQRTHFQDDGAFC